LNRPFASGTLALKRARTSRRSSSVDCQARFFSRSINPGAASPGSAISAAAASSLGCPGAAVRSRSSVASTRASARASPLAKERSSSATRARIMTADRRSSAA
jgi:hypothetical protein